MTRRNPSTSRLAAILMLPAVLGLGCTSKHETGREQGNAGSGATSGIGGDVRVPELGTEATQHVSLDRAPRDEAIALPDGTPDELLRYAAQLLEQPLPEDPNQRSRRYRALWAARAALSDKVLAAQSTRPQQLSAVRMKLDALRRLSLIDSARPPQSFEQYVDSLLTSNDRQWVRLAGIARLQARVDQFASYAGQNPQPVMDQIQRVLTDPEPDAEVFQAARQAAMQLHQARHPDLAATALRQIAARFAAHTDKSLVAQASTLTMHADWIVLHSQALAVVDNRPGAQDVLDTSLASLLQTHPLDSTLLSLTLSTASTLEYRGEKDSARQMYETIRDAYVRHAEQGLAHEAQLTVQRAVRRLTLPGQTMQLTGQLADGSEFNWDAYRGQVVLVEFWAAGHGPCVQELENIKRVYYTYRHQGFQVVGINLDEDRMVLAQFLARHRLPWPVVVSGDVDAAGFEDPNAIRCGVDAIPFGVLVDRQGIVRHIHACGSELTERVAQLMSQ